MESAALKAASSSSTRGSGWEPRAELGRCQEGHVDHAEIRLASSLPPTTAMHVQMAWPTIAPRVTPKGSLAAASAMVAICERSPHSARKVR
eukprot:scaffold107507_cov69-Phaeocystis_antarctica.AAC.5